MSKPRNPGYRAGDHWLICDVCGHAYRHSNMKKRWDGAVVCKYDWEPRHPQDFLRARKDDQTPKGLVRTEPSDQFIPQDFCSLEERVGIAGEGVAGCMITGHPGFNLTSRSDEVI